MSLRGRALLPAALVAALALALLPGCAHPPTGPHRRADGRTSGQPRPRPAGRAGPEAAAAAAPPYRRWGLSAPLTPPPRHTRRRPAGSAGPGLPPVVDHVPTRDRVVFLTYDDGVERDPRLLDMVRELHLPVTLFLTDSVLGPGYGQLARLRAVGAGIQNHTLDHSALGGLPYAGQRAEICGQQHKLRARFGVRPRLLRPPYGAHDPMTRRAAADCGVAAVVLWRATPGEGAGPAFTRGPHRLRPGDIVAVDPDGTGGADLRARTVRLLEAAQREGLSVGRLEDYL
ncbi:polysaccharide deacetylase family protein [Streptomyces sp. MS06]|uniref:polysaccharide deacetylase family protein n=1 Tax=Streptomyces sp. MS06 TaxID=3385974 RepID=UPI00399F638E